MFTKAWIRRSLKVFIIASIILLVSFAVIIGIARSVFIYVDHYKPHLEELASKKLQQPVKVERIKLDWHGINPVFTFNNVSILDPNTKQALIKVRQFQLGVSVFSSLWHFKIQPSVIHLQGTHLTIHQLDKNQIDINGIKFNLPNPQTQSMSDVGNLLEWLIQQNEIFVNRVSIDFYTKSNKLIPLNDIKIKLKKTFLQHKLIAVAKLAQNIPAHLRLVLDLKGDFFATSNIKASIYLQAQNFSLKQWLQDYAWHDWRLTDGRIERLELWADYENHHVVNWQVLLDAYKIQLNSPSIKSPYQFDHFAGNFMWEHQERGWKLSADQVQMTPNGHIWPSLQFKLAYVPGVDDEQNINIETSYLNVSDFTYLLLTTNKVPTNLQDSIKKLQPKGALSQVKLALHKANQTWDWDIAGKFTKVNFAAWQKIPGVENLQGDFDINAAEGEVNLIGENLTLTIQKIFPQALSLTNYKANVFWQRHTDVIDMKVRELLLENPFLKIEGEMNLAVPQNQNNEGPFIALSAGFVQQDLSQLKNYVPTKILNPELAKWLQQAFPAGDNAQGTIILQGPLKQFPFDDLSGKFEMDIQTHNIDFNYSADWPMLKNVDAIVNFNNRSMEVTAKKATIFDVSITNVAARIADLGKAILTVNGQLFTDMSKGQQFILASPLAKTVGQVIEDLKFAGAMRLDLNLQIPFIAHQNVQVNGLISLLKENSLEVPLWHTKLDQLQGAIKFTQDGLFAEGMTANLFGRPAKIKIDTTAKAKSTVTQIALNSTISIAELDKQYPNTFWGYLKGDTKYQALVELFKVKQNNTVRLTVQSDLKGINIDLPAPWGKIASDNKPFVMQLSMPTEDAFNLTMQYNNLLSSALSFGHEPSGWEFYSGEVRFGTTQAQIQDLKGLVISGHLNEFDWTKFSEFLKTRFKTTTTTTQSSALIRLVDLDFDKLSALGMNINQIRVRAQPSDLGWLLNVSSPVLTGKISLPENMAKNAIRADLDYLYLDPNAVKSKTNLQPNQIPAISLICHNFDYGQKHIGQLSLDLTPAGNSLRIDKLVVRAPSAIINATGVWQRARGKDQTSLQGRLESENMGSVLRDWQITQSMAGGRGAIAFSLSWPTPIYSVSSALINGDVSMNFRDGRIINIGESAETEMGFGRVLNLLSLQTLPRRLQLDFSDLTQKGFSFDTLQGKFTLKSGNAFTTLTELNGPVAKVTINGRIGLAAKDYDLIMNITPYVTSSLPVIATIAGGPIAGAVTWVANKVIGGAVNKISTQVYRVRGSWDNPDIQKV